MLRLLSRILKRLLLICFLLFLSLTLTRSTIPQVVLSEDPKTTIEWEMVTTFSNHIGDRVIAVLRMTAPLGVRPNLSLLPEVGETLELYREEPITTPQGIPPRFFEYYSGPSIIAEGELEVWERSVNYYVRDGLGVTEITYTFQYLLPIDFTRAFTLKHVPSQIFFQTFLKINEKSGLPKKTSRIVKAPEAEFYLLRRVKEGDEPIFEVIRFVSPTLGLAFYLKISGLGLIVGTLVAQSWVGIRRRRKREAVVLTTPERSPTLCSLYGAWRCSGEYKVFLEAVKLYRSGFWGRPHPMRWIKTTFILYSGRVLSLQQIEKTFTQLMEVRDDTIS